MSYVLRSKEYNSEASTFFAMGNFNIKWVLVVYKKFAS